MPKRPIVAARALAVAWMVTLSAVLLGGCSLSPVPARAQAGAFPQMPLGNPDNATSNAANKQHYLMARPQYVLSYNDDLRFPNWVAWRLVAKDIGNAERGQFMPDPALPSGFTRITPSDYTRSGYDRGHNCPSKDRSASRSANDAVFYMTNMTPQMHGMNAGPWERLESYSRDLAKAGNDLYIYCGHGFSKKPYKTIGTDKIAVPDFGWKIVVVLPTGPGEPARRITAATRVIAVRMPNISTISNKDWREFRTSVQDIEQATGLHFFDVLPAEVAAQLKNRVDFDQPAPSRQSGTKPSSSGPAPTKPPAGVPTEGQVWVNTRSGAYWRPGTQFYGKTKQGKYMSEADAIKAGYHAAGGQ